MLKFKIAIGAGAAVLLAACAGGGTSTGKITLNYWGFTGGITSKTAAKAIADFQASHPNVTVNGVVLDTADFDVKLPAVFDSATGPDIVYSGSEPNHLGRFVNAKQVLQLDDVWSKYGWDKLIPSVQARTSYGGHHYAVGNELETLGLMYNKKIFDQLGLQVPTTLEQLEQTMATIKQKAPNLVPMILACGGPCYSGLHMMHALGYATIPTQEILNTTSNGAGSYTDPGWLEMLQRFQKWNQAGYFPKGADGIGDENHWSDLCSGKAAMMVEGTWFFSTISDCEKANPDKFGFGFAPFPVKQGLPFQVYVGTGKAWFFRESISKDAQKKQAALELIAAMNNASSTLSWVRQDQKFPAVPFDKSQVTLTDQQKTALQIIDQAGPNGGAVDISFNNSAAETNLWVSGLQGIIAGSSTPQQLISGLQSELKKLQADWQKS